MKGDTGFRLQEQRRRKELSNAEVLGSSLVELLYTGASSVKGSKSFISAFASTGTGEGGVSSSPVRDRRTVDCAEQTHEETMTDNREERAVSLRFCHHRNCEQIEITFLRN